MVAPATFPNTAFSLLNNILILWELLPGLAWSVDLNCKSRLSYNYTNTIYDNYATLFWTHDCWS